MKNTYNTMNIVKLTYRNLRLETHLRPKIVRYIMLFHGNIVPSVPQRVRWFETNR